MIQVYSSAINRMCLDRKDVPNLTDYDRFKDSVMNAKIFKALPHMFFPEADWTIWLDGNVKLKVEPETLVDMVERAQYSVGAFPHWERDSLFEEADVCKKLFPEQCFTIEKQVDPYDALGLAMCFLLVRKNTPAVNRANERWWTEICCGSTRDQISFPVAFESMWHPLPRVCFNDNEYFTRVV